MTASQSPTRDDFEFMAAAAQACAVNAHSLAEEARLLLAAGYSARALALAISSLEEDGKQTAFTRQATVFDPDFRHTISKRSHPVRLHDEKQGAAVQSLRNVFEPLAVEELVGRDPPHNPIADIDLEEVNAEMRGRRESALYVDSDGKAVHSPLDEIGEDEARKYVRLAATASDIRKWIRGSEVSHIADYLEVYREVWLEQEGDRDWTGLGIDVAAARWGAMRDAISAAFTVVQDDNGNPASIVPVR